MRRPTTHFESIPPVRSRISIAAVALLASTLVRADTTAAQETIAPMLAPIVVSGEQPGPGMWKVSKGDHVLWILGSLTPLPNKMTWLAREVEATIAQSQEVLMPASVNFSVKGGAIGGLFLLPSLLGARNNPDKQELVDVVPAELYPRWLELKQKYLGDDDTVENRRPIFAAFELYDKALRSAGLSDDSVIDPVVAKAAKKNRIEVTQPRIELKLDKARATVKEFARTSLDDIECFRKTIERLEGDLGVMQARANAWASGDLEALAGLVYVDQNKACREAFLRTSIAQEKGVDDLPERVATLWLEAADKALANNAVTFATLPIGRLLDGGGYLDRLRARGYEIEAPQ